MNPKLKRIFRITGNLFFAIITVSFLAVCAVDELYEFVSDDVDVFLAMYETGTEEMVLIKSALENGEGELKASTRLVNPYRITEYIAWYMESGSDVHYNLLAENLTENDMLYVDRLASTRHAGRVAQKLMYVFCAGFVIYLVGICIYSGIVFLIKRRKNPSPDKEESAEESTVKFDPVKLVIPMTVGIPYLLLIIIATYFPETITECFAKLLKMDTLPALTQGDVLHAIFTPDILHSFIREMFLSFKDDIVWLFVVALIPMVREFIKKKFPFLSLEETTETDSEVDNH